MLSTGQSSVWSQTSLDCLRKFLMDSPRFCSRLRMETTIFLVFLLAKNCCINAHHNIIARPLQVHGRLDISEIIIGRSSHYTSFYSWRILTKTPIRGSPYREAHDSQRACNHGLTYMHLFFPCSLSWSRNRVARDWFLSLLLLQCVSWWVSWWDWSFRIDWFPRIKHVMPVIWSVSIF